MVTFNAPQQIGPSTFRLTWSSDQPGPFRIFVDGVLVSLQASAEYILTITQGEAPVIEILDIAAQVPKIPHPGHLVLGWKLDEDAAKYLVQQYVGGVWTDRATIVSDVTKPWMTHVTPTLDDETTHTWRVIPIDAAGNQGTPTQHAALMVRAPDIPVVAMAYNAGTRVVTISAA